MADSKITALTALTTADPATDMFPVVDVSDTTMAASGTTKRISINNILACSPTATLASATITGDLTVDTSTLKVDSANNRVGVGTTSPAVRFNIADADNPANGTIRLGVGAIYSQIKMSASSTGRTDFTNVGNGVNGAYNFSIDGQDQYRIAASGVFSWYDGAGGTRMTLNSTGLGVGVTPSAWGSMKAVQVLGASFVGDSAGVNRARVINNAYYTGSGYIYLQTNFAQMYVQNALDGTHGWLTAPSGTAGNAATFTQAMTLDASGRLLIGSSASGTAAGDGVVKLGTYGHCVSQTGASIASGSSVDLTVITSGAGYQGFLSVAVTQDASANTRTQTTYSVFGRGTTSTITQIATANGSIGGASFTVTTPSNGVIRITNTSGAAATISAQFFGGASL